MIDGDRKQQESMGRLVQGLRSELETSRRQITDLTIKDSKAADAILALERKVESMRTETTQLQAQNTNLNKDLKSSQVCSRLDDTPTRSFADRGIESAARAECNDGEDVLVQKPPVLFA